MRRTPHQGRIEGGEQMAETFGPYLKEMRLRAGFGLRPFAELIGMQPSNLSALEHDRRSPPAEPEKLREMADALRLQPGSAEWDAFFDLASQPDGLPADVRHLVKRPWLPELLRTIDRRGMSDQAVADLIHQIDSQSGG
jgi:transcriptional regulator with XRE-family HTH domain